MKPSIFFQPTLLFSLFFLPCTVMAAPLSPVNLGAASEFVVLGGSLISNIPGSDITGNIGLSPAAGSNITGIGPSEITGIIYTVDATGPAGSVAAATKLTTAQGDLTIAYNDAAGRTPVPSGTFLNPGAGDIGGMTLVPGLYKFTSGVSVSITGSDVTLSGSSTDVWIFQIATTLNVGNGIHVVLAGGAKASNVFWQVGTSATLGTTSVFKGTIMADQSIVLNTGASVEGRLLARIAAITLESNTLVMPADYVVAIQSAGNSLGFGFYNAKGSYLSRTSAISYHIERAGEVSLKVYNTVGTEVATLFSGFQEVGSHTLNLNQVNTNRIGTQGVYYVTLKSNGMETTQRLMF
jgi:hypothetical protein